jgi:gamma-polyglutamate synthase
VLFLYLVFVACALPLLVAGVLEQRRHNAHLDRIPIRVLVNGTRGKSSITRLCSGALRGGGLVTVAKTTGTAARFIHPDGSEEPVHRKFDIPNVAEQIAVVARAAEFRPDALVVECMAVAPDLQEISQTKLVRSTIGVLSNIREDHLTEMGPTLDDVARSFCRALPDGGVCVTAERERLPVLLAEARRRNCQVVAVDPESVSDSEMQGFPYRTFKENVAIALGVAQVVGVTRDAALAGMWTAAPDPGVVSVRRFQIGHKRVRFANVFAANDPQSTLMNIRQLSADGAIRPPMLVMINCRADRIERNAQMGALVPELVPDSVFLIGHPTKSSAQAIPEDWRARVIDLGGVQRSADEILGSVLDQIDVEASLIAIGNIHGQGEMLIDALETYEVFEEFASPELIHPAVEPATLELAHPSLAMSRSTRL